MHMSVVCCHFVIECYFVVECHCICMKIVLFNIPHKLPQTLSIKHSQECAFLIMSAHSKI